MPLVIAIAGLSGAGKTTAADYLVSLGLGQKVYLGKIVLDEVLARGLSNNPENERAVRIHLRDQYGPGILLRRAAPDIARLLEGGANVFVDAIFEIEEYRVLRECCGSLRLILLGIEATFDTRSNRLYSRVDRPLTSDDLKRRDATELRKLATDSVLAQSNQTIRNEGSLEDFHAELQRFLMAEIALS